jgi:hypothetical protein
MDRPTTTGPSQNRRPDSVVLQDQGSADIDQLAAHGDQAASDRDLAYGVDRDAYDSGSRTHNGGAAHELKHSARRATRDRSRSGVRRSLRATLRWISSTASTAKSSQLVTHKAATEGPEPDPVRDRLSRSVSHCVPRGRSPVWFAGLFTRTSVVRFSGSGPSLRDL